MIQYNRREFLGQALFNSMLALPALSALGQVPTGVPDLPRDQASIKKLINTPFRAITQCIMIAAESDQLYCADRNISLAVPISTKVKVWKGLERNDTSDLKPGDVLDIRLEAGRDGIYRATYIWANVVKYEGIIIKMLDDGMKILPFFPNTQREKLTDTPMVVRWTQRTMFPEGTTAADFRLQRAVMVFGLRLPGGIIEASRVVFGDNNPPNR